MFLLGYPLLFGGHNISSFDMHPMLENTFESVEVASATIEEAFLFCVTMAAAACLALGTCQLGKQKTM